MWMVATDCSPFWPSNHFESVVFHLVNPPSALYNSLVSKSCATSALNTPWHGRLPLQITTNSVKFGDNAHPYIRSKVVQKDDELIPRTFLQFIIGKCTHEACDSIWQSVMLRDRRSGTNPSVCIILSELQTAQFRTTRSFLSLFFLCVSC